MMTAQILDTNGDGEDRVGIADRPTQISSSTPASTASYDDDDDDVDHVDDDDMTQSTEINIEEGRHAQNIMNSLSLENIGRIWTPVSLIF
jgi:hypothetical protein